MICQEVSHSSEITVKARVRLESFKTLPNSWNETIIQDWDRLWKQTKYLIQNLALRHHQLFLNFPSGRKQLLFHSYLVFRLIFMEFVGCWIWLKLLLYYKVGLNYASQIWCKLAHMSLDVSVNYLILCAQKQHVTLTKQHRFYAV